MSHDTLWAESERSLEIPAEAHTGGLRLSRDEQEGRSTYISSLSSTIFLSLSLYIYHCIDSVLLFDAIFLFYKLVCEPTM